MAQDKKNPLVLVVDDDAGMRQSVNDLLAYSGYRVLPMRSAREALGMILSQEITPGVIISDLSMPDMTGYEFFDALRAAPAGARIPFIFLTGRQAPESVPDFRSARYLVKPFEIPDLLAAVETALRPAPSDTKIKITFEIEGHEVLAETLTDLLHNEMLVEAMQRMARVIEQKPTVQLCPTHQQPPEAVIALSPTGELTTHIRGCCQQVVKSTTRSLGDTLKETAPLRPPSTLVLHPQGADRPLALNIDQIDDWVIGRSDPEQDFVPDIDLAPYGAVETGVSRSHAMLIWWHGALHIVDQGSANGTHLNGQRLMPDHPARLSDGDRLSLANFAITLNFDTTIADTL